MHYTWVSPHLWLFHYQIILSQEVIRIDEFGQGAHVSKVGPFPADLSGVNHCCRGILVAQAGEWTLTLGHGQTPALCFQDVSTAAPCRAGSLLAVSWNKESFGTELVSLSVLPLTFRSAVSPGLSLLDGVSFCSWTSPKGKLMTFPN